MSRKGIAVVDDEPGVTRSLELDREAIEARARDEWFPIP
jgi:hypothetical protein